MNAKEHGNESASRSALTAVHIATAQATRTVCIILQKRDLQTEMGDTANGSWGSRELGQHIAREKMNSTTGRLGKAWEPLRMRLVGMGFSEKEINAYRTVFYRGAAELWMIIGDHTRKLDANLIAELNAELSAFAEQK